MRRAALLAFALLAAGSSPRPFSWADVQVPDVQQVIPVHGALEADGIPVRARQFVSGAPLQTLAQFFLRTFEEGGLYVPPAKDQLRVDGAFQLTALDPARRISFTVLLTPGGEGTSIVTLAEAQLQMAAATPPTWPALPPDAAHVTAVNVESARTVSFQSPQSEADLTAFFRRTLGAAGLREVEPGLFRSATTEVSVRVRALDERTRAGLLIIRKKGVAP